MTWQLPGLHLRLYQYFFIVREDDHAHELISMHQR